MALGSLTKSLSLLLLLSLPARGQTKPVQFPAPKFDVPLFLSDVAARSFDVTTTNHAFKHGGRELELPGFIVNHTAVLVGFEAINVGSRMLLQRELIRHNHTRWARAIGIVDVSLSTAVDLHNNRVGRRR